MEKRALNGGQLGGSPGFGSVDEFGIYMAIHGYTWLYMDVKLPGQLSPSRFISGTIFFLVNSCIYLCISNLHL